MYLPALERSRAVIVGARFQGIQPFFGFGQPGYHHDRKVRAQPANLVKEGAIRRRIAVAKHSIGVLYLSGSVRTVANYHFVPLVAEHAGEVRLYALLQPGADDFSHKDSFEY